MIPHAADFRAWYVQQGGSPLSANSYVRYLRRVDALCSGIDHWTPDRSIEELVDWVESMPARAFGSDKNRRDSLSAVRKYAGFFSKRLPTLATASIPPPRAEAVVANAEVLEVLRAAKGLGARYYRLTGKPLGVTGEVAELAAAEKLGLILCNARQPGFDAWNPSKGDRHRVQIKGRAVDACDRYRGRCPAIKFGDLFDTVVLVLLDNTTLEPLEIWEASEERVAARITAPGGKARTERHSLGISQFKSVANCVWSAKQSPPE